MGHAGCLWPGRHGTCTFVHIKFSVCVMSVCSVQKSRILKQIEEAMIWGKRCI